MCPTFRMNQEDASHDANGETTVLVTWCLAFGLRNFMGKIRPGGGGYQGSIQHTLPETNVWLRRLYIFLAGPGFLQQVRAVSFRKGNHDAIRKTECIKK